MKQHVPDQVPIRFRPGSDLVPIRFRSRSDLVPMRFVLKLIQPAHRTPLLEWRAVHLIWHRFFHHMTCDNLHIPEPALQEPWPEHRH